jgi:hypothetical protein
MITKNQSAVFLRLGLALAIGAGSMTSALAQTPGSAAKPNTTIPEKQHMGPVTQPQNGVITPRHDTDPDMSKSPPPQSPAETPVIPPSSTPGGSEAK